MFNRDNPALSQNFALNKTRKILIGSNWVVTEQGLKQRIRDRVLQEAIEL